MVVAGGLEGGDISFVGNAGGAVLRRRGFGHDDLIGFGGNGSKRAIIGVVQKIAGSADAGGNAAIVDTDSVEAKTVVGSRVPDGRSDLGASGTNIAGSVRDGNTEGLRERMVLLGHDLITPTGGSGNSNNIGGGGADPGGEGAEIDGEVVNGKRKLVKSIVDILKSGFDDITGGGIGSGSILADIVGEGIIGRVLLAGGHIEISPVNDVRRGGKVLGQSFYRKKKGEQNENNSKL